MSKEITIAILGGRSVGKTTIATIIEDALMYLGLNSELIEEDPDPYKNISEKIEAIKDVKIKIISHTILETLMENVKYE